MPSETRTIHSKSPNETKRAGRQLGESVGPGTVITLQGDLGAGKTVFAKGIAEGLGVPSWRGSPTFNLVHEYEGRLPLFHIDAYRIDNAELTDLDLPRMTGASGVIVVEWPGHVSSALRGVGGITEIAVEISDIGDDIRTILIHQ